MGSSTQAGYILKLHGEEKEIGCLSKIPGHSVHKPCDSVCGNLCLHSE